jgi:pimeloyl-ACP methyl ester carboxylesterase
MVLAGGALMMVGVEPPPALLATTEEHFAAVLVLVGAGAGLALAALGAAAGRVGAMVLVGGALRVEPPPALLAAAEERFAPAVGGGTVSFGRISMLAHGSSMVGVSSLAIVENPSSVLPMLIGEEGRVFPRRSSPR